MDMKWALVVQVRPVGKYMLLGFPSASGMDRLQFESCSTLFASLLPEVNRRLVASEGSTPWTEKISVYAMTSMLILMSILERVIRC